MVAIFIEKFREIKVENFGIKSSTSHKCNPILLYIFILRIKNCFL